MLDEKHFEAMNFIESRPISEAGATSFYMLQFIKNLIVYIYT